MNFRRASRCFWLALLTLVAPAVGHAGWKELLPAAGGAVNRIAVDAGGTRYVVTSGGIYKSADGGNNWVSAQGNLPTTSITPIAPDPVAVGVVYAGTEAGLFRTTDSGGTWTRLPLETASGAPIQEIAIAPSKTSYIFVSTWGAYVYRSLDGGATWSQTSSGLSGGSNGPAFITSMAVDPTNENRVYTSTWRGRLFRSDNAAGSWSQMGDSNTWANGQIVVSRSNPHVLYTNHDSYWFGRSSVVRSDDFGTTWTNLVQPAGAGDAGQIAVDPTNSSVAYVTTGVGIYKTANSGGSWTPVLQLLGQTAMNAVAVVPSSPQSVLAGSAYSGFYNSDDGGASFVQANAGIAAATVTGLAVCRNNPDRMYAGLQGAGFFRSTDAGATWSAIGGAQGLGLHSLGTVACKPDDANVVVLSTSRDGVDYIWRSTNGGASFTAVSTNYAAGGFQFNPSAPITILGTAPDWQGGFLASTTGGATWFNPFNWYINPVHYDFHPTKNVAVGVGNQYTGVAQNAVWVLWSNSGGTSGWTGASFGAGDFTDIALDQDTGSMIYVAGAIASEGTRGIYKFMPKYAGTSLSTVSRVSGTFNNGLTNTSIRRLQQDPVNDRLYVTTANGVFRSSDQAASWMPLGDGLPYPSTTELAVQPDGSAITVGTNGGVWQYSDSIPVMAAVPVLSSTPPQLIIPAVAGSALQVTVKATTTTANDALTLVVAGPLPAHASFPGAIGNPASATLAFTPALSQIGEASAVQFAATSSLDPTKTASMTRYLAVLRNAATDVVALLSKDSSGQVSTPDGLFAARFGTGSVEVQVPLALIRLPELAGAQVQVSGPEGKTGKATALIAYDTIVGGQRQFGFAAPVAFTFAIEAAAATSFAALQVATWDGASGLYLPRTDTSCLAGLGLPAQTGSPSGGGTLSVCAFSIVAGWALIDMSTFIADIVDTTPPLITAQVSPAPNANRWNNTDVVVTFTATDDSTTAICTSLNATLSIEGAGQVVSTTCTDAAGNSATKSVTVNIDKTPPAVSATRTPLADAQGWNNGGVMATLCAADALSGLDGDAAVTVPFASEGAGQGASHLFSDLAGNTAVAAIGDISIDQTPPTLAVGLPGCGYFVTEAAPFWLAANVGDLSPVTVSATGGTAVSPDATGKVFLPLVPGPGDGEYSWQLTATDAAGNQAIQPVTVLLDTTPPVITTPLVDGAQGPLPDDRFTFTVVVADLSATVGAFGTGKAVVLPPGGGSISDNAPLAEGENRLSLTVTDEAGHTTSIERSVFYDKTPPGVAFVAPAPGSFQRGKLTPAVTGSDALTGVATVTFSLDGGDLSAGTFDGIHWNGAQIDTEGLVDGTHALSVTLVDSAGNSSVARSEFVVDNTPPTVAIVTPGPGAYVRGLIGIRITANDAQSGVASLAVTVDGIPLGECPAESTSCGLSFDTTTRPDGPFTIATTAMDKVGNVSAMAEVTVVADQSAPTITCPANRTATSAAGESGTNVAFGNATATDPFATLQVTCDKASGSFFSNGTTPVICTADDGYHQSTCTFNVVVNPAVTCADRVKNGHESDVDCGGGTCPKCINGKQCSANVDCVSNRCTNHLCVAPPVTCGPGNSLDLGAEHQVSRVKNNACLRVSQYPSWGAYMHSVILQPQGSGSVWPLSYTWTNCNSSGSGSLPGQWQQKTLKPVSNTCTTYVKLGGTGSGSLDVSWWGNG